MKKLVLIAAVIGFFGAGLANAGGAAVNFDFDGRATSAGNHMEIIDSVDITRTFACEPVPRVEPAALSADLVSGNIEAPDLVLDWSIRTAIEYARHNNSPDIKRKFLRLLKEGTIEEKTEFVREDRTAYSFPERFTPVFRLSGKSLRRSVANNNKIREQICVRTRMEELCGYQLVCEIVCGTAIIGGGAIVGGSAGAAVGSVVSGPACPRICKDVKECRMVEVCDEWVTVPVNIGQDSNGNWS